MTGVMHRATVGRLSGLTLVAVWSSDLLSRRAERERIRREEPRPIEYQRPKASSLCRAARGHTTFVAAGAWRPAKSGLHGFSLQIPSAYANGVSHSLQAHYETSSTTLGSPITLTCGSTAIYTGWFDRAACDSMSGWAADRSRPDQGISVDVLDGTLVIATLLANASRPDVGAAIGDAGAHGFSLATPSALKDGQAHSVRVRYSGTTQFVGNSPQVVQCSR